MAEQTHNSAYELALASTLANAAYDALLVVDEHCQIITMNESARELFPDDDPIGKRIVDLTGAAELELIIGDALAKHEEEPFEEQLIIDERHYRVRTRVTQIEGQRIVGLGLQDITRLVRLNRARRDMVANISHELRTPLANIQVIIDSLFHDQDKPKRKESIKSLKTIAAEMDSLKWIVQEMADLSMIESGQSIVRMIELPLREIVEDAAERMRDQSEAKDLRIKTHIPHDLMVLCDPELMRRVLINLIHNAIKWSPRGGKIVVDATSGEEEATITVRDEGPGVPDEQTERIFERFYQVDVSRSGGEGTGLGLAICKHVVEAHGGRIWALGSSQVKGGYFAFTLLTAEQDENA